MSFRSVLALVERAADIVAAFSLAFVALLTTAAVVLRTFGANVPDAIDFSSLVMGVTVFWAAAIAFKHDDNVRVDFLASIVTPRIRIAIRTTANLIAAFFMILMAVAGAQQMRLAYRSGEVTPELRVDLWPFVAIAWFGLALTALMALALALGWLGRPLSQKPLGESSETAEGGVLYGE